MLHKFLKRIRYHEKFTFMLVPHSNTRVVKYNLTRGFVFGMLAIFLITAIVSGLMIARYNNMKENMDELAYLREINEKQKEEIDSLAAETEEIYTQIERLQQLDEKVRSILNIDDDNQSSISGIPSVFISAATRSDVTGGMATRGSSREYTQILQGDLEYLQGELTLWEDQLNELIDQAEDHVKFVAAKPAGWPTSGRITSGFGNRRSPTGRGTEFHLGIDIANSRGTKIKATGAGKVISAGWQGGYGWTVVIDHGYGYQTLYAHASSLAVETGDRVTRGTVIAYMGSSGRATGPHVHYEVIYRGENQNPSLYLKRP